MSTNVTVIIFKNMGNGLYEAKYGHMTLYCDYVNTNGPYVKLTLRGHTIATFNNNWVRIRWSSE